ncbi:MAG: GNAT family N-acetyltransferase [Oscillospiraceae bacterium]|nr:GNAT family N-acetyltransferase [Oscillospiraceae bacterium]
MQITTATTNDIQKIKELWVQIFGDSENFAQFAANICPPDGIYLVKDNEEIAAMVIAGIDLFAYDKKGFYIYGLATVPQYRGKGLAKQLVEYVCEDKFKNGYQFCITQPAQESLFEFYKKLGFEGTTYLRKATIDIKRNLWATASFDTATATRFKEMRGKFSEDEIIHFSPKGYEKFAEYIYSEGGSTAETKNGYCLYFEDKDKIIVRDLFAQSTQHATVLLQAIRERTGKEVFEIQLSQNSQLFLGEGKLYPHCVVKNLDKELYANLMFD